MRPVDEGTLAVRVARAALRRRLLDGDRSDPQPSGDEGSLPATFDELRGTFVTLKRAPSGALRGCIGFPLPVYPLGTAVARAAVAAAVDDPRFRPVRPEELDAITIEVSILTKPEPVLGNGADARRAAVRVGRHGLILEGRGTSGLLLPQVATEYGWDAETFLRETCGKAGLPPGAWKEDDVRLWTFEAAVFAEVKPGGSVVRVEGVTRPGRDEAA